MELQGYDYEENDKYERLRLSFAVPVDMLKSRVGNVCNHEY